MQTTGPIEAPTKSDLVFQRLLENIRTGRWAVGFRLPSENELARSFVVSRNSVRSAIQRLAALGILEPRNGEGSFVKPYSADLIANSLLSMLVLNPDEIVALLEFRKGIEISSCELAAKKKTDAQIAELEGIAGAMRSLAAAGNYPEFARIDYGFHACVARMSGNFFIENVIRMLEAPISSHFEAMSRRMELDGYIDLHERIAHAIKNGDPEAASSLMKESLEKSIAEVLAFDKGENR